MKGILLLAALAILPSAELPERCDLLDDNTVIQDEDGRYVLRQWLVYDWHADKGCHHIARWKLWKHEEARHDFATGEWVVVIEGHEYRAKVYRMTVSNFDPELRDRELLPVNKRRLK